MKSVAVVICNYNKRDFILACIESVFASKFNDYDLIVVDNASVDGSVDTIQERFGDRLKLLINKENIGGSGGFNRGMAYAMQHGYKYIHLLDNDVLLDNSAIGELYNFMEANEDVGACGSLICRMAIKDRIQDFGAMIDLDHIGVIPLYGGQMVNSDIPEKIECDYVAACSAMFRSDVLKEVGIIDKEFFIYWDDMALCWEIRNAGKKVCAYKKSVVWHMGSYGDRTAFSRYYSLRNKIYCFTKYLKDDEFEKFIDILIDMMYRVFAVNINNADYMNNYFFALDDALNGIRGKVEEYKILSTGNINDRFKSKFLNVKKVLIIFDPCVPEIDRLINKIKEISNPKIYIYSKTNDIPEVNIARVEKLDDSYDVIVKLCYHILEVDSYNRKYIYIDKYDNMIIDNFDFYKNYNEHKAFYNSIFSDFIRKKLLVLRKNVLKCV